jgi:hypothetical protein
MIPQWAYQGSDELDRAMRARLDEMGAWDDTHLLAWNDAHPDAPPFIRRRSYGTPVDGHIVGFEDRHRDRTPPEGLRRTQQRSYLTPHHSSRAGQPYRDFMVTFNDSRPRLADVLDELGVSVQELDVNRGRVWFPSIELCRLPGQAGVWFLYQGVKPRECAHLAEIPVSAYHVERERIAALRELQDVKTP